MGIKDCRTFLNDCGIVINNLDKLRGSTIAIDALTYIVRIYKFNNILIWKQKFVEIFKVFENFNIKIILVIDGFDKPKEKTINIERKNNIEHIKNQIYLCERQIDSYKKLSFLGKMDESKNKEYKKLICEIKKMKIYIKLPKRDEIEELIKYLLLYKFILVRSEGEAEATCCKMYNDNVVDYILSEDSDVLLYPIDKYLTRFNVSNNSLKLVYKEEVSLKNKIPYNLFFYFCCLCGTDYNDVENVNINYIKENINKYTIENLCDIINNNSTVKLDRLIEIYSLNNKTYTYINL